MRRTILTVGLALIASGAFAKGTTVAFDSLAGKGSGYLVEPSGKGKHPALIVIQEWWGLNDWVKDQAERYAGEGFVALAPDLYRGKIATTPEVAHELMRGLPQDRAIADMKAAFNYLASRKDVDASRIGVIGWCMGGGFALDLTLAEPRIAATVINYGHLVTDPASIAKIHAPLLGNFGGKDQGITPADVNAFATALKKDGKKFDIKVYHDAGHAFMNPNNKAGYVKADAEDAQARIDRFLRGTLKRT
ncbi:MAG TPA: dienelactone hydrolase family protein [Thermoanaerobaculia bacterium]